MYLPPRGIFHSRAGTRALTVVGFHSGRPTARNSERETISGTSKPLLLVCRPWDHLLRAVAILAPGLVFPPVPVVWPRVALPQPKAEHPVNIASCPSHR